ncbi:MAG: YHS domain-containing protein [Bacillus sp. (in: Bacteria)]|nr:YHS domain-containing protein [Bacillus sp. (in: firmicutes)]
MYLSKVAKDPVCKMEINVDSSTPKTTYLGEVYYFCALACLAKFESNPQMYITAETKECCGHCGKSDEKGDSHQEHHHHGHCNNHN